MICLSDFNTKHEAWGCHFSNTRGRTVFNFITNNHSKIISPASPIYCPSHANRHSVFFISNLPNNLNTNITNLNDLVSDHTTIILQIQENITLHPTNKKCTNWNKFRNIMTATLFATKKFCQWLQCHKIPVKQYSWYPLKIVYFITYSR